MSPTTRKGTSKKNLQNPSKPSRSSSVAAKRGLLSRRQSPQTSKGEKQNSGASSRIQKLASGRTRNTKAGTKSSSPHLGETFPKRRPSKPIVEASDDSCPNDALDNEPITVLQVGQDLRSRRNSNGTESIVRTEQSTDDLKVAYNRLKIELFETRRDKLSYASAFSTLNDQLKLLKKENKRLEQDKIALEAALEKGRNGKRGRKFIWSADSLQNSNMAQYQGICLSALSLAKHEAFLVTTETYRDENSTRLRRNWNGSAITVNAEVALNAVQHVLYPDGSFGIPTCCMQRALQRQDYISPYINAKDFLLHCLKKVLFGPVGSHLTEAEKDRCIIDVGTHAETKQKFQSLLWDSLGNRKKASLRIFLRSLGYNSGVKPDSKSLSNEEKEARAMERELVFDRSIKVDSNGLVDTMHWRLAKFSELRLSREIEEDIDQDGELNGTETVDNLFMNEAARRAFQSLRGYSVLANTEDQQNTVSIVTLARADACMTTMLKWIKVGGRGGIRNTNFKECFRQMLPKAMEAIIKDIWDDVKAMVPHEMRPYIGHNMDTTDDPYGNHLREWTLVTKGPEDNYLYLLAKPSYFLKLVCSWYGNVIDCHIGRCSLHDEVFTKIDASISFENVEESDVDDVSDEEETMNNSSQINEEDCVEESDAMSTSTDAEEADTINMKEVLTEFADRNDISLSI